MKEIELTKNAMALVDDEDFEFLSKFQWVCNIQGRSCYALRIANYSDDKRHTLAMHRLIMKLQRGDARYIDHIDGNGLNNQKENLRVVTKAQNGWNQGVRKSNSSGYKGVSWHKGMGKWQAKIRCKGEIHYLGFFEIKKEAATAYNNGAIKYHGEHARLNELKEEI